MEKPELRPVETPGESPETLAALFEGYSERIFLYLQYRCDDTATAQDLAGQVFDRLFRSLPKYDPQRAPLSAWVFSIAHHVVTDWQRRQYLHRIFPWEDFFRYPSAEPGPEQVLLESEQRLQLWAALGQLSERERDLVALRFSSDLTNRQIAELTGLSQGNVAVILFRALRKLRQRLTPTGEITCPDSTCSNGGEP